MSNIAIILASGSGSRFRSETPKQFLKLADKKVLEHTLDVFEHHSRIDEVIVVVATNTRERLLIVDNTSTDGTRDWLAGWSPNHMSHGALLALPENGGGAGGFARGAANCA